MKSPCIALALTIAAMIPGAATDAAEPVTFIRDVLPAMNKVGCSNGTCHGAAKGKNGFKLSLRGYDPEFDYQSLLYDMSGRRFNRADPERSLMLAKPTMQVPHEGGLRLDLGGRYYNLILDWIRAGVPYGDPARDRVERLEFHPAEVFMNRPGMRQQTTVIAHYDDGKSRDVTREAHVTSSNTETMAIEETPSGPVATGLRRGESTLLVRYEGQFTTAPVTVLSGREGFEWTALPQANYIDELIDEKLQRIEVQPSAPIDDAAFLRRASLDLTGRIPSPEAVRAFLENDAPTQEKRSRLVDELIASDAYVDHWTLKWGDLLRSNRKFMSYKGMLTFRGWLREAIEETGLLPGVVAAKGPPGGEVVREAREALLGGGASFAAVLGKLGARLDGGAVEYIAHWVTPEVEPRRYDTRFFAARVPTGSMAVYDAREMTDAVWLTPRAALDRHRRGGLPMIFPTIRTLEDLCDFATVEDLLAHYRPRAIERVQPTIVRTATGVRLRVP